MPAPPQARHVPRPRLVEQLDEGVQRPLTLVSAPAGSGKTSLLNEWLAVGNPPGPVARIPPADGSDGSVGFWSALATAVRAVTPGPTSMVFPSREALAELEEPVVVVIDDFHLIGSPAVARDIDALLEQGGDRLRLLVATRRDPSLRLERLRLNGLMSEVRAADLAFTMEETDHLLGGLELPEDDLELLWRLTEGWVAGLRLAQLSLESREDRSAFIKRFAGDDHAVSDYLISEVVERQPPDTLNFLLRTCVVERLTGGLADALTGGHDGDRTLRDLAGRDGLVSSVGGEGRGFRYHPLLREVLRAESRARLPGDQASLHQRAASWHAREGSAVEALRHAIVAADWRLAGEVIVERWLEALTQGRGPVLLELAEQLPPEIVRADAELAVAVAGLRLEAGDDAGGDDLLAASARSASTLPKERVRRYEVTSATVTLYRARLGGDVEGALRAANRALAGEWDSDLAVEVRALALINLGIVELWAGAVESAALHLQQAVGLALECSNDFLLFRANSYAAAADSVAGRLNEARLRAEVAIQLAERHGWTELAHAAVAYFAQGSVHLWRGELTEAERLCALAGAGLAGSGRSFVAPTVALLQATLTALRGDPVTALDIARSVTAQPPVPRTVEVAAALLEAEILLALGEPDRARGAVAGVNPHDAAIVTARVHLAKGDAQAALGAIATVLDSEREGMVPFARVEAHVLEAVACDALRDEAGALAALERALDMAEPRGCPLVIVRYGAPLRSLLNRLVAHGTAHRSLVDDLLGRLERSRTREPTAAPLLEPLSQRELTVLRYLPTMMSNADIAAEMFVSVNTVKTHLKHVYRKLDVTDRRECVRRGRELRLLSSGVGDR